MSVDESVWASLEAESASSGLAWRRLHPAACHDLRVAVDQVTLTRSLVYVRPWSAHDAVPQLTRTRAVQVESRVAGAGQGATVTVSLSLMDSALRDVFSALVTDVVDAIAVTDTHGAGTAALISRLEHWQHLLASVADDGLNPAARRGLAGELWLLREIMLPVLGPDAGVAAWTGPYATNQDFQTLNCAVEVKTTATKQPQGFVVANERQLDGSGVDALYLLHLSLDERRGGTGESLNSLAQGVRSTLGNNARPTAMFDDKLARSGYFAKHRPLYDEPRYTVRVASFFAVVDGFPRIVESDLDAGVGDVRYTVALSACEPYEVERDLVRQSLLPSEASRADQQ